MKTTFRILLACAIVFLTYICVDSVVTPIEFEETRVQREEAVVKNLIHIRTAEKLEEAKQYYGMLLSDAETSSLPAGDLKERNEGVSGLYEADGVYATADAVRSFCKENGAKGLIFSNPCNPTSLGLDRASVRKIIEARRIFRVLYRLKRPLRQAVINRHPRKNRHCSHHAKYQI